MEGVQEIDELGTIDGVSASEPTARENAELKKLSDGPVLEHFYKTSPSHPSPLPAANSLG